MTHVRITHQEWSQAMKRTQTVVAVSDHVAAFWLNESKQTTCEKVEHLSAGLQLAIVAV